MNNEETQKFKEQILKRIIEVEKSIINIQPRLLETRLSEVSSKLEKYTERLNEIEKMANKDKLLIDSIHDLKSWKFDAQQQISKNDVKLQGVYKDLKDTISKYDRIYLENLFLPGVVGEQNCKFRNMRDFIEVSR